MNRILGTTGRVFCRSQDAAMTTNFSKFQMMFNLAENACDGFENIPNTFTTLRRIQSMVLTFEHDAQLLLHAICSQIIVWRLLWQGCGMDISSGRHGVGYRLI